MEKLPGTRLHQKNTKLIQHSKLERSISTHKYIPNERAEH